MTGDVAIVVSQPPSPHNSFAKRPSLLSPVPKGQPTSSLTAAAPCRQQARSAPPVLATAVPIASLADDKILSFDEETEPEVLVTGGWLRPRSGLDASDDEDLAEQTNKIARTRANRAGSIGHSWGISSVGKGFDWRWKDESSEDDSSPVKLDDPVDPLSPPTQATTTIQVTQPSSPPALPPLSVSGTAFSASPLGSPTTSNSSRPLTPPVHSRAPSSPRPRRRSSQMRVSLVAGRLSMISVEPPPSPPHRPLMSLDAPRISRLSSTSSFLSIGSSVAGPPTPKSEYLGGKSIDDYVILGEAGRGAYGLVKRGKEILPDGTFGPMVIIKQIIKSRILADCWKKHPVHGTIPIEIYVMQTLSSTSYLLPERRPWDPSRRWLKLPAPDSTSTSPDSPTPTPTPTSNMPLWTEGKVVNGHPNICPLLDFFEDKNYYYLILPSTSPRRAPPPSPPPPSDLFDLVELHPQGLPPHLIRSYLGQMADALCFLHARGIVHRDIKDENVVLGDEDGQCWLIDFGSSGIVRRGGWDTFSGTLDYAGPEILRGERYTGKEQDVWAYGVVAYVLLVGECPFTTASEAQEGLIAGSRANDALEERCAQGHEAEGEEFDGGGRLEDAAALVRECLHVEVTGRPTFEKILTCRFLAGGDGWGA